MRLAAIIFLAILALSLTAPLATAAVTFTQVNNFASPALSSGQAFPAINPDLSVPLVFVTTSGTEAGLTVNSRVYRIHSNGTFMHAVLNSTQFVPPIACDNIRGAWNTDGTKLAVTGACSNINYLRVYNRTGTADAPVMTWHGANVTTRDYNTPSPCNTAWPIQWVNVTTFGLNRGGCQDVLTTAYYWTGTTYSGIASISRGRGWVTSSDNGFITTDSFAGGSCGSPWVTHMGFNTVTQTWDQWAGTTTPAFPSSVSNCIGGVGWSPNGDYLLVCGVNGSRIYTTSGSNPAVASFIAASDPGGGTQSPGSGYALWSPDSKLAVCPVGWSGSPNLFQGFRRTANGTWFASETITFSPAVNTNPGSLWDIFWFNNGANFLAPAYSSPGSWSLFTSNVTFVRPPDGPTNLVATGGRAVINLTWTAAGGATSYVICRSEVSVPIATSCASYSTIGSTASTIYSDSTAKVGVTYCYRIRADAGSVEGGVSNEACAIAERDFTPIFGDSGSIYAGSKAQTAANFRIGETALGLLWGLMLTLAITLAGYGVFKGLGAAIGAIIGVVVSTAVDFFPLWAVAFVGVSFTALYVYAKTRSDGGA